MEVGVMKSKFKGVLPRPAVFVLGCLLFGGCEDIIKGPPAAPPPAPGDGRVVIVIGSGIERTVLPQADQFSKITLGFERKDGTGTMQDVEVNVGESVVSLNPGTWELTASAYNAEKVLVAQAKNTLTRTGDNITGDSYFALAPVGTGPGTLRYTIALPQGMSLDPALSRIRIEQQGEVLKEEAVSAGINGAEVSLDPGQYVVDILLDDAATIRTAAYIEAAAILPGLVTELRFAPEPGDFLDPDERAALSAGGTFGRTKNNNSKTLVGASGGTGANKTQEFTVSNGTENAYFTLTKARTSTVTLGGEAAGKVNVATGGIVDGHTASPTLAVFTVDTSALADTGGSLAFTLSLGEPGKTPLVYTITVNIPVLNYLHVVTWPSRRVYMTGNAFDPAGLELWGIYSNEELKQVTGGYTFKGFDSSVPGEMPVEIEKHGISAKKYSTNTTGGVIIGSSPKIYYDRIEEEDFFIKVVSPAERALFFWHGLTADYKPQPKQYTVPVGRTLTLAPAKWLIPDNAVYEWKLDGAVVQSGPSEYFSYTAAASSGEHTIRVAVKVDGIEFADETTVVCTPAAVQRQKQTTSSVQAEKLYSVVAPGQFGATSERLGTMHGFGGFGGYAVFKFDHSVMKQPGGEEMSIAGNAFAGWQEPGAVWVSQDDNGNGEPDDTWYELQGSHTFHPLTLRRYVLTYRRDSTWINNQGVGGGFPPEYNYWREIPPSITEMTLVGTRLDIAYNAVPMPGYVDAINNGRFSISNAILEDGTPVELAFIDFVKIVTAFHHWDPLFGERSTELRAVTDRSMGDPDSHASGKDLYNGQYEYTFTNNSGYDLTIEILEGGETFTLVRGAKVVKTITGKSGIYLDYYGGNVKMQSSAEGNVSFSNG
jgi:hypothetical protein